MSLAETDLNEALSLVNVARQAFGKDLLTELPDARPGDSSDCLFYRAMLDMGVTSVSAETIDFDDTRKASYIGALWGTSVSGRTVRQPGQFSRTINRFDTEKLPHYNTNKPAHF